MRKILLLSLIFFPLQALGQITITEIMYDAEGTDSGYEWFEIHNGGGAAVDLTGWKFFEAETNHALSLFGSGSLTVSPGGYAVVASNPEKFLEKWQSLGGLIKSSWSSFSNTGETFVIKNPSLEAVHAVTYDSSSGAAGDGKSLQMVGSTWVAKPATPGAAPETALPDLSSPLDPPAADQAVATTNPPQSSAIVPLVPTLTVSIQTSSKTAIAGADVLFEGRVLGINKQPIDNARLIWNFGDGASKEGKNVLHSFSYPGDYIVVLDAASGELAGTARLRLKVVTPDIALSAISQGPDGFIELVNRSSYELDLSSWRLSNSELFFSFPKNTIIPGHQTIKFATKTIGFSTLNAKVALLYPNGTVATEYQAPETPSNREVAVPNEPPPSPAKIEGAPVEQKKVAAKAKKEPSISAVSQSAQTAALIETLPDENTKAPRELVVEPEKNSYLWYAAFGGLLTLAVAGYLVFGRKKDEITIIE
ncbi:MAG: lamin tail domain-containing protein [bacterium]|nr:lamin tail domain-containing protein [bacterium]